MTEPSPSPDIGPRSKRPFPPYNYIPGNGVHPEKEGGYHFGKKIYFEKLNENPFENSDFNYALDLYQYKYFWEAHVYLEGLWHQVRKLKDQRSLDLSHFLKAFIKLCAAQVKSIQGDLDSSRKHQERAIELFQLIQDKSLEKNLFAQVRPHLG